MVASIGMSETRYSSTPTTMSTTMSDTSDMVAS